MSRFHHYMKPQVAPSITWPVPQLCAAYQWPTGMPGGGVIAIVELGGGWLQSDMQKFFGMIGQPLPSITDVNAGGAGNFPGFSDADGECALDIQTAAAAYYVATGKPATIRMYWANDIATGVRAAVNDGCDVVSISWGADEALWGPAALDDMEAAAQEAVAAGTIVFAASGDSDADDGGGATGVDAPASCPHVVGCGGTRKMPDDETVWNDTPGNPSGEGTGGGYSAHFPVQGWQVGSPKAPTGLGRMVPDVSANADPVTGLQIVVAGQVVSIGGTSAVAPLYAGLFSAFGKKLGWITPKLFENQHVFNDIVSGENGVYSAAIGPDPVSGLGSPIGTALAALFVKTSAVTAKMEAVDVSDLAHRVAKLEAAVAALHAPNYFPGTGVHPRGSGAG